MGAEQSPNQQIVRFTQSGELFGFYAIGVLRQRRLPDPTTTPEGLWLRKCGRAAEKIVAKFVEVQELRDLASILIHSDTLR
ncbi:MAG: hypothetical protein E5X43_01100 [Mesorhizobium sp.]|nr:MAG: hypothetical protein E5X43_01100 [Mesorhizobium sp.]